MSQRVVTPPAAAHRVAVSMPGQPVDDEVCIWPSTSPGRMRILAVIDRFGCRWRHSRANHGDDFPTERNIAARHTESEVTTVPMMMRSNGSDTFIRNLPNERRPFYLGPMSRAPVRGNAPANRG